MGLFSTKKKDIVDSAVVPVIDEALLPNAILQALVESTINNQEIVPTIKDYALNSTFRDFERMYRFARDGKYFYGLPNARVLTSHDGFEIFRDFISLDIRRRGGEDASKTLIVDYMHFRPLNNIHMGWQTITEQHAYDHDTNRLEPPGGQAGVAYYMTKMVAVHNATEPGEIEASAIGFWGTPPQAGGETPRSNLYAGAGALAALVPQHEFRIGPNETESVEIHYAWIEEVADGPDVIRDGMFVVDLSGFDTDQEFYQARIRYIDDKGQNKNEEITEYFTYDPVTGDISELNQVFDPPPVVDPGTYFPFVMFRSQDDNRTDDDNQGTPAYESTQDLLKIIGMDFAEMGEQIHENPDIGDVRQAVMMMGVPINAEEQVEIEYLYEYFTNIIGELPDDAVKDPALDMDRLTSTTAGSDKSYALQVTDADFDMTISFDTIRLNYRSGAIGNVGDFTNTTGAPRQTAGALVFDLAGEQYIDPEEMRVISKQLMTDIYVEIEVHNPKVRYRVFKNRGAEGGLNDDKLLIPLDYEVARRINILKREELYHRSLHLVFNSHVRQKVRWYERGVFQIFLVVVAVAITIFSGGTTWQAIVAAAATGGASAVAVLLLKILITTLLRSFLVQLVVAEVVEAIGIDAAWLAIAVAVAYGAYDIASAGGTITSTAKNLLSVATNLAGGINNEIKRQFQELQSDAEALRLEQEAMSEQLAELEALLDTNLGLDPMAIIRPEPLMIWGETPDQLYGRTIHSGNVGIESYAIIQNFVDISLRLPTTHETLGAIDDLQSA